MAVALIPYEFAPVFDSKLPRLSLDVRPRLAWGLASDLWNAALREGRKAEAVLKTTGPRLPRPLPAR